MMQKLLQIFYAALPLFFALSIAPGFDIHIARLYIVFLGILYGVIALYKKNLFLPRGPVAFTLLALLLWASCSILYSDVPLWSARKIIYFWSFAPLFIVLVGIFQEKKAAKEKIIQTVVLGGTVAASSGVSQFFAQFLIGRDALESLWQQITPFFLGGTFSQSVAAFNSWFVYVAGHDVFRAIGFFPDPHVYAFYTGMILPFTFYLWQKKKKKIWAWCGVLILAANLLTFSRGGEVGILAAGIVSLLFLWPRLSLKGRRATGALIAALMLFVAIPNPLTQRFVSSFSSADTSNTARIEIWQEALHIWAHNPLLGVGLGAYPYAVDSEASYRTPIYAHNIFLDIGVELGLVGCILFVFLIMRMFHIFFRQKSILAACAIISMIILLTHGLFDTPLFSVHVFPLILLLAGLAASYEQRNTQPE